MSINQASVGTTFTLQDAATTGNGNVMLNPATSKDFTVYVVGAGTISSGVVTIEEAHDPEYSGTWSSIQAVTASDVTGGAVKAYHISGKYRAVRARVSTTIGGGGTISAYAICA